MIKGLRRNGVEVLECHQPLWHGIEDRVHSVSGGWKNPRFWWRVVRTYAQLLNQYRAFHNHYDILIVGYPGQFDVFLARILSWIAGKPLVWDVFMSIYLIARERGLDRASPSIVKLVRWVEWIACRLPNRLVLDTEEYAMWFAQTHGVYRQRFMLVPTGADSDSFVAHHQTPAEHHPFTVLYYGTFIPNHGVQTIIESANELKHEEFRIMLIGEGPDRLAAEALAAQYSLSNVTFINWLDHSALVEQIRVADVHLGVFGSTPQSMMTIQNKIYEGLAMGKAVLSGDSPAIRRVLTHGREIFLCERENPIALAQSIRTLAQDIQLRAQLGKAGYEWFWQSYDIGHLGKLYVEGLMDI